MRFVAILVSTLALAARAASFAWSPTDHTAYISVTTVSAVRISASGGTWNMARSDLSQSSGVRYVEFTVNAIGGGPYGLMVGLANGAANPTKKAGEDNNGVSYWSIGGTIKNNTWGPSAPAYTTGDVIGMLVDLNAHTVKFSKNGGSYSATIDITSLGTDVFVAATLGDTAPYGSVTITADSWVDPAINLVCHGDSMTLTGGVQQTWCPRLATLIQANQGGSVTWTRAGINGASWNFAWSQAGYPYTLTQDIAYRVTPALSVNVPNWVVVFAGTNGIQLGFHSAATEYANLQTYLGSLIAAGVPASHIVVSTMLPRTGLSEVTRSAYNAAIVADVGAIGYKVARLDLSSIGAAGDNLDTAKYYDGTHPTDTGQAVIAATARPLISP